MILQQILDPKLGQFSYLIGCQQTGEAIIVDPQRDIERYLEMAQNAKLRIVAAADTHIHADFLSGLRQFGELPGILVYASAEGGEGWQYEWLRNSDLHHRLLQNDDTFFIGSVKFTAWHTPGHTPEHLSFVLTDLLRNPNKPAALLSGDFVFVSDVGRPDLLEVAVGQIGTMRESASTLFDSLQQFKALPEDLLLLPGHGAGSACGRSLGAVPASTVGYELDSNPSILAASSKQLFVDYIVAGQPDPPPYFERMKRLNREGPPLLDSHPDPRQIDHSELTSLHAKPNTVFLDTRNWDQFKLGHIPGALFAPLEKSFTTTVGSYVGVDEQICLIIPAERLEEAVLDCIRIGLDNVVAYITPKEFRRYIEGGGQVATMEQTEMSDLENRMQLPDTLVIDVRNVAELHETGMIAGTFNIPHTQMLKRHAAIPRGSNVHVFCRTGNRSRAACGCLARLGHKVTLVDGGIEAWKQMSGTLVPVGSPSPASSQLS